MMAIDDYGPLMKISDSDTEKDPVYDLNQLEPMNKYPTKVLYLIMEDKNIPQKRDSIHRHKPDGRIRYLKTI